MKILISGASGTIGTALTHYLQSDAAGHGPHVVQRLVRRPARNANEVQWNPASATLDPRVMDNIDAVVNLSGAGIAGGLWTRSYKEVLYSSRINATRTLVDAMHQAERPPRVFISQSASGYYGDRGAEILSEHAGSGDTLLADICRKWEHAASAAPSSVRTILLRTGIVMTPQGGALPKLLLPLRFGAGGPLGTGTQWWPWVTLDDVVRAIAFLLIGDVEGPVNIAAPHPAPLNEVVEQLGRSLERPTRFRVPEKILTTVMGQLARELLLVSARLEPEVLNREQFLFRQESLADLGGWVRSSVRW